MSVSKIFIPNFVRVLTNKRNYIEPDFYSVAGIMPQGWDLGLLGGGGVKNFSVGICDGAPSTAHSSSHWFYSFTEKAMSSCLLLESSFNTFITW